MVPERGTNMGALEAPAAAVTALRHRTRTRGQASRRSAENPALTRLVACPRFPERRGRPEQRPSATGRAAGTVGRAPTIGPRRTRRAAHAPLAAHSGVRQPVVVPAAGDGPPDGSLRQGPAGAAPRSAKRTPPDGAPREQGWRDYERGEESGDKWGGCARYRACRIISTGRKKVRSEIGDATKP